MNSSEQEPEIIDTHSSEIEERWRTEGRVYRRKIEPLVHAVQLAEPKTVETTLPDGTVESTVDAKAGDWIITGTKGERFVMVDSKVQQHYVTDEQGRLIPRERRIRAFKNPFGRPVSIVAPWSTPEKQEFQHGSEQAMFVVALDAQGNFSATDRYLIGDEEMLLNNYEPVSESDGHGVTS